jgi:choline kinase
MNVIILSAGRSKRMGTLSKNLPKPLFTIKNYPIILILIKQLLKYENITNIVVVGGYKYEQFLFLNSYSRKIKLIFNPAWDCKNNAYSFLVGTNFCRDDPSDLLVIEADCIYSTEMLDYIMLKEKEKKNVIFCDYMEGYNGSKITINKNNKIVKMDIQKGIKKNDNNELKSIGIMKFSHLTRIQLISDIIQAEEKKYKNYLDLFVWDLIRKKKFQFDAVNCNGHKWIEIDTPKEYKQAKKMFEV